VGPHRLCNRKGCDQKMIHLRGAPKRPFHRRSFVSEAANFEHRCSACSRIRGGLLNIGTDWSAQNAAHLAAVSLCVRPTIAVLLHSPVCELKKMLSLVSSVNVV
jgi:hypothetical protein